MIDRPVYTRHAREQMAERRIQEWEVEAVLTERQWIRQDKKGNPIFNGVVRDREIDVVVAKGSRPPRIITLIFRGRMSD